MILYYIVIGLVGLLAHGPMLIDRGFYGDGWWYRLAVQRNQWRVLKKFFSEVGLNVNYYLIRGVYYIGGWSLFRWISFLSFIVQAICVFEIARRFPGMSPEIALMIGLFCLTFPSDHSGVDVVVSLQYHAMKAIYYLGMALIWGGNSMMEVSLMAKIVAWILIFIGFHANSILPYHYGLIIVLGYWHGGMAVDWWKEFIKNHGMLFLLPIIHWVYKEVFTPRHGNYSQYNRVKMNLMGFIWGFGSAFYYPYWKTIQEIVIENIKFFWGIAILIGIQIAGIAMPFKIFEVNFEGAPQMFFSGIALTFFASFAYVAVGLSHPMRGIGTRYNLLLPLPFSMIVVGGITSVVGYLFPGRSDLIQWLAMGILIVLIFHWIMIYGCYFFQSSKYDAFNRYLEKCDPNERATLVGITDRFAVSWVTPETQNLYWTAMIQDQWGQPAFAVEGNILNKEIEGLERAREETTVPEFVGPFPKNDARKLEIIINSNLINSEKLMGWDFALKGWKAIFLKIFKSEKYEQWAQKNIHVTVFK